MPATDHMSEYSKLAHRRFRQYQWQEQKKSIKSQMLKLILRILQAFFATFQRAGIIRRKESQTVNVE